MKKILAITYCIFAIAIMGCSQKINVPAAVTNAFNNRYPGASNVKWGKENAKEFEAEFKLNGNNVSANFGTDGTWVESETGIKVADLPAAVVATIIKTHAITTIANRKAANHCTSGCIYRNEEFITAAGKQPVSFFYPVRDPLVLHPGLSASEHPP